MATQTIEAEVSKDDEVITVQFYQFNAKAWRVYKKVKRGWTNWVVTQGHNFATLDEAKQFLKGKGYEVVEA